MPCHKPSTNTFLARLKASACVDPLLCMRRFFAGHTSASASDDREGDRGAQKSHHHHPHPASSWTMTRKMVSDVSLASAARGRAHQ